MGNVLRFATEIDDKVSKKLIGISKAFDKIGGPGSGASLFGNVGAKAVAKGFGLIDTAASALVGTLGDALSAAMDEEVSIRKLDNALWQNIAGWDGNTDAIERVLGARMALGFSDDEQRNSLSLLLVATNDVNKALDYQSVAMDLARLTGVDLDTATKALIKTEDGGFRLLKQLGIAIDEDATAEEALTAVRKAAEGQAATYAETTSGKLLVAQTKIGEKMEQLGGAIMPAVASSLDSISNAIAFFSGDPTVQGTAAMEALRSAMRAIGDAISWVIGRVGDLIGALVSVIDFAGKALDAVGKLPGGAADFLTQGGFSHAPEFRASGGPVAAHGTYIVGEKGPETLVMGDRAGWVIPNGGGMGGAPVIIPIVIDGREVARVVDERLYYALTRAAPAGVQT